MPDEGLVQQGPESDFSLRKMVIAAACLFGATFVPYVQATIAPLMMLPMMKELGWTRTEYAFGSTFLFIFGSITVLAYGRIADRIGVRPILLAGSVFGGATMLLLSLQTSQLWRFYATYALLGAFGSSGVGYTKIIGSLFTRHRGKALALFGAESTVALAVLPVLTNAFISRFGWRGTYVAFAIIMFALTPVIFLLIQEPGVKTPFFRSGAGAAKSGGPPPRKLPPMEGMTISEIRRDRVFWLIVLSAVLGFGLSVGLSAHIIAAITDKGFSPTVAAEVLSVSTLMGLVGTFAGGFAVDHFRDARPMAAFGVLSAAGLLLFALATAAFGGLPLLILAMALQGMAVAAMRPVATYLQTRFLGLRAFGEANAIQVVFQGFAMAASPPLFGIVFDRTGSYAPMYWVLIVASIAGSAVFLFLGPYRYRTDIGVDLGTPPIGGRDQAGGLELAKVADDT